MNIVIAPLSFPSSDEQHIDVAFKPIVYLMAKEETHLELTGQDMRFGNEYGGWIVPRANKLYDETYELAINFQDIEGRRYKQILKMEKSHCIPQPVTLAINQ